MVDGQSGKGDRVRPFDRGKWYEWWDKWNKKKEKEEKDKESDDE